MTSIKPRPTKKPAAKKAKTAADKKVPKILSLKKSAPGEAKTRTAKQTSPKASRKVAGAASLTDLLLNANSLHLEIVDAVPELGIRAARATRAAPKCKYKMQRISPPSTEVNLYRWSADIQDFDFIGRMPRDQAVAIIRACVES